MTPAAIWRNVDFPEPLRPTNPTRSPSKIVTVARSNTIWLPKRTISSLALATELRVGSDIPPDNTLSACDQLIGVARCGPDVRIDGQRGILKSAAWPSDNCCAVIETPAFAPARTGRRSKR